MTLQTWSNIGDIAAIVGAVIAAAFCLTWAARGRPFSSTMGLHVFAWTCWATLLVCWVSVHALDWVGVRAFLIVRAVLYLVFILLIAWRFLLMRDALRSNKNRGTQ